MIGCSAERVKLFLRFPSSLPSRARFSNGRPVGAQAHVALQALSARALIDALEQEVGTAGRLERLLLVLAFAYVLLLLIGLVCRDTMSEALWALAASKSRDQACGFTVGRYMLDRVKWRLKTLLAAFARMLTEWVEENWG